MSYSAFEILMALEFLSTIYEVDHGRCDDGQQFMCLWNAAEEQPTTPEYTAIGGSVTDCVELLIGALGLEFTGLQVQAPDHMKGAQA